MILEAKNLSFRYEESGRKILDQFSLQVDSSERVGILAPSGFGKTTLCKILSGYEEPEAGTVLLDGKSLYSYKDYCPVQMIWQHPEQAVNPRLRMRTVIEEGDQVDPKLIEKLGIEPDWLNRFPTELSGGELQRFCIARALGKRTRFLLADEISTMLDLITQSQIWHFLIEETERRGIGMIVVSHSPELVEKVCTRVVRMEI
ncbi:ATP-binding cassette domain-containing protein [Ruminococcus sp. AF41-9]|nr:ATP-binding cassette domain-containing protein [Ruminococcus sp. AF41-9]